MRPSQIFNIWRARRAGNEIVHDGVTLDRVRFQISGRDNRIVIGAGSNLSGVEFLIWGNNHRVEIGQHSRIGPGSQIWIEDNSCELSIGARSTFQHHVHLAATENGSKIEIGCDCMFAYNIDVRTGDSHSILDAHTKKRVNHARDVRIGDHVWIGPHSSVLKGSVLSPNSIIATRSVVTGQFPEPNIIVGGSPARILRRDIDWSRERL